MTTLSNWPGTPAMYLNANNIDGEDNLLVAHGDDVSSWKVEGSAALDDFLPVGATEAVRLRANPYLKKSNVETSVAFDGVYNQLTSDGSASKLNFIHTTGVFDLLFVARRRASGSARRIFGCSGGSGQKGLQLLQQTGAAGTDGNLEVTIGNNAGLLVSADFAIEFELAKPTFFLLRGDGTRLRLTKNFYRWENVDFTGALGTGDAYGDYGLGSALPTTLTPNLFEGDLFLMVLYSSNLTLPQLLAARAEAESQVGDGV